MTNAAARPAGVERATVDRTAFNGRGDLPCALRTHDTLRPAIMSGLLSDMLTASLAKHSRTLTENRHHNGHPDLVVRGRYADDRVQSGADGVEVKTTRKAGGAVDTHGAREQWMGVFVYSVDTTSEPAGARAPMRFTEVYLGRVVVDDFRRNERGALGTRTATPHAAGVAKLREPWVYRLPAQGSPEQPRARREAVTPGAPRGRARRRAP